MLLETAMAGKRGLRSYTLDMTETVRCWSYMAFLMKEQSSLQEFLT